MRRAVHRLVLRAEQRFDLIVCLVNRARPPSLLLALPSQRQCRLGEGRFFTSRVEIIRSGVVAFD